MPASAANPATLTTVRAHLEHIERGDIAQATRDYAEDGALEAGRRGAEARMLLHHVFAVDDG